MNEITCRKDAIEKVNEIMNEKFLMPLTHKDVTILDILTDVKDTADVETLVELKTTIVGMLDNEIIFRLKK